MVMDRWYGVRARDALAIDAADRAARLRRLAEGVTPLDYSASQRAEPEEQSSAPIEHLMRVVSALAVAVEHLTDHVRDRAIAVEAVTAANGDDLD